MSNEITHKPKDDAAQIMERVLLAGDLNKLAAGDRIRYYNAVCESVGLNPLTTPFEYITLNNKLTLYAKKSCTDQLRSIHGVSITIASREKQGDIYIVSARATNAAGRVDEDVGAVTVGRLAGDALCNAMMKAETKAKRRVTLSICGLGMLDETEVATVLDAKIVPIEKVHDVGVIRSPEGMKTPNDPEDSQPVPPIEESQVEREAAPPVPPQSKGAPYKEIFLAAVGKVLDKRGNIDQSATLKAALTKLADKYQMTPDNVSPDVGGRMIKAVGEGHFDVPLTSQTEAA